MAGNIQEFDAGQLTLRPTETGVEARAGTARRIGAFFNQQASAEDMLARETSRLAGETQQLGGETARLGEQKGAALAETGRRFGSAIEAAGNVALKYAEHQDISRATPAFARLTQQATDSWNKIAKTADPNDPTVAAKFLDSLDGDLQQFKDNGFLTENGQKWADAHTDALRQHMAEKTQADMATLAGHAAVVNQQQTINSLSNTVRSDPSSLDFSLAALKSGTEGMISSSPNLTGVQASAARSEILQKGAESIVKSAAMGYIEKTGQIPPWASDPKYAPYINGAEIKQFEQASKYYKRLGDSETKAARQQRDYENKAEFNQRINALEAATMPQNIGDKPQLPNNYWQALRDLATHPGAAFEPGRLKTMVESGERIAERLNKPEPLARVSHAATVDLLTQMHNGQMSTNEDIYKAYGEGKLSDSDFNFLNREFKESKTPEGQSLDRDRSTFFKQYAGTIAGPTYDPVTGSPKLYAAEMDARRVEGDLRKKGLDPHLAYDPTSEYFMGKPANLLKYQGSLQQDLSTKAATPSTPPKMTEGGAPSEPPRALRGIAVLKWSPTRQQYRDETTGEIYNRDGTKVKQQKPAEMPQ